MVFFCSLRFVNILSIMASSSSSSPSGWYGNAKLNGSKVSGEVWFNQFSPDGEVTPNLTPTLEYYFFDNEASDFDCTFELYTVNRVTKHHRTVIRFGHLTFQEKPLVLAFHLKEGSSSKGLVLAIDETHWEPSGESVVGKSSMQKIFQAAWDAHLQYGRIGAYHFVSHSCQHWNNLFLENLRVKPNTTASDAVATVFKAMALAVIMVYSPQPNPKRQYKPSE